MPKISEKKSSGKASTNGEVKYPVPTATLRGKHTPEGALTVEEAKELIGWHVAEPGEYYSLTDRFGKQIVLGNSPSNRPFRLPLAERYCSEHIRGTWAFNLESIVFDRLGHVQQGQHRLVGFILAEQDRSISPHLHGKDPLVFETLLGFGASEAPETADTYDTGTTRSLQDVIYRHQEFGSDIDDAASEKLAKVEAGALRLVWLRVGGETVSFAPHFPHSEAMQFKREHPKLLKSVIKIHELDKSTDKGISSLISPAYASGLHYLMTTTEAGKDKADEFWELFSTGAEMATGNPVLTLRQMLTKQSAGSGGQRDEIIMLVIKAFNAWVAGETYNPKQLAIKKTKQGERFINAEHPQLGGIDCTPPNVDRLSKPQLLLISLLRNGTKTYAQLAEGSGMQVGQMSKYLIKETKTGKVYEDSLEAKGFVEQFDEEDQPIQFKLTAKGLASLKK